MKGILVGAIMAGAILSSGCVTTAAIMACGLDDCDGALDAAWKVDEDIFDAVFGSNDRPQDLPERVSVEGVLYQAATFSPDGQWLAYEAQGGIYVRPYPGLEPATLISDAGHAPAWSPNGREIYYRQAGVLWAVDVTPGDEFQAGRPAPFIDPWRE